MSENENHIVLTPEQFAHLGEGSVGYIRKIRSDDLLARYPGIAEIAPGLELWALFAANGMPILVAYAYKPSLQRILERFPGARHLDAKSSTIRDWNAGKIPMLVAHPGSAGPGLNLQDGGNIIVYFDPDWSLDGHDQILERIGPTRQLQAGHPRTVFAYYLTARHTVDELVLQRLVDRRDEQDILLNATREK